MAFLLMLLATAHVAHAAPASVQVRTVKATDLFEVLTYPARVVPKINTTILSETDGIVTKISAPLGQSVSARQKVMTITHTDPVYQFAPMIVKAPVAGVVSAVEITEGSQVVKGQRLASVTDPKQVRLTVEVPAQDLPYISRNMSAEFKATGRGEALAVRVRGVSPFVDPATGTATCELELDARHAPSTLAPGMLGQVLFKANLHKGYSIPDGAVVFKGTDTFVRLVENGKARQQPVKLGARQRGYVEVLEGLTDNVSLIERTSRYVADGEEISVEGAAK